ncbi:MAG: hybrid sensor histidine kinase/response regulator [Spirochaetales bacterium]|nr:hybrid sensor histidine kinase/response regulator [Spirochaetales bacterium]
MDSRDGTYTILYVDDEFENLYLFRSLFEDQYDVQTAESGAQALAVLADREVQVLMADQRMPGISGIQLLETVGEEYPQTIRILVTGYSDIDVVIDAINRGDVYRYLSKPWDIEEIRATIRNAIELYELKLKNQSLIGSLRKKIEELEFLNKLQLDLKGLTDKQSILRSAIIRLRDELEAEQGCHCELQGGSLLSVCLQGEEIREGNEMIGRLDLGNITNPTTTKRADGRSICILPLLFQGISFGHLVFQFPHAAPFDPAELPFAEAASNIVSSVLYSQHIHREEMQKEQFLVLGQMASMIVHDLKGPLATILGFVSLLQAELASSQRREFTGIIDQEVKRLLDMVEELLDFSKGRRHLEIAPIDLPGLFQEVMELFDISLKKENIRTEIHLDGMHGVRGDRNKLKKVFINLLQNAREFLQRIDGKRIIRIRSGRRGDSVLIRFINNGPAIPGELLPKLFDPFFSHDKDQGTGLGLTICKKIIEEHNGSIQVFSQPGNNEFRIILPAGSDPCPDSKNHSPEQ